MLLKKTHLIYYYVGLLDYRALLTAQLLRNTDGTGQELNRNV